MIYLYWIHRLEAEKEAKNVAMAAALTTFLKNVGVRVQGNQALERCPSFTAREKRAILPTRQRPTKKVCEFNRLYPWVFL